MSALNGDSRRSEERYVAALDAFVSGTRGFDWRRGDAGEAMRSLLSGAERAADAVAPRSAGDADACFAEELFRRLRVRWAATRLDEEIACVLPAGAFDCAEAVAGATIVAGDLRRMIPSRGSAGGWVGARLAAAVAAAGAVVERDAPDEPAPSGPEDESYAD